MLICTVREHGKYHKPSGDGRELYMVMVKWDYLEGGEGGGTWVSVFSMGSGVQEAIRVRLVWSAYDELPFITECSRHLALLMSDQTQKSLP